MSSPAESRAELEARYAASARAYLRSLTQEHFMEATAQATQREITLESLALVKPRRPDVHVFNELLVQFRRPGRKKLGQVVPDNMVVLYDGPIHADGSFDLPTQPAGPFFVLEYVSKGSERKDYEDSYDKYEQELKVPYYLLFYPDNQELTLYHHDGEKYVSVKPNERGRLTIPELEMEVAIHEGWARFWFRGEMLPLPADLQAALEEMSRRLADTSRRLAEETRRADEATRRAQATEEENARLRAELERLRGRPDAGP
jgi:Uma2 family endonuclease